jgi:hypothetical protein
MNIKEVTIKQLVDIADRNWGYRKKGHRMVSTNLSMLKYDNGTSTGSIRSKTIHCIEIFNPFVQRGAKLIGLYTLTDKEWKRLEKSGLIEELNKPACEFNSDKIDEICKKLYR